MWYMHNGIGRCTAWRLHVIGCVIQILFLENCPFLFQQSVRLYYFEKESLESGK